MNYQSEILHILSEADAERGLSLNNIAHHVCNMTNCDLFETRDYEDIRKDVAKFLRQQSTIKGSPIEKAPQRGFYRLNSSYNNVQQLTFKFDLDLPCFE